MIRRACGSGNALSEISVSGFRLAPLDFVILEPKPTTLLQSARLRRASVGHYMKSTPFQRLVLLSLLCIARPAPAQTPSSTQGTTSAPLLRCQDWSHLSTEMPDRDFDDWLAKHHPSASESISTLTVNERFQTSYLEGLQYGYVSALEFVYQKLQRDTGENPDKQFDSKWSMYLSPRTGVTWDIFLYPVNQNCGDEANAGVRVADEAVAALNMVDERPAKFEADERNAYLGGFGCSQYNAHPRAAFVAGYRDGQRYYWSLLDQIGLTKIPRWKDILAAQDTHQFAIPAGKALDQVIDDFCLDAKNKNIPFVFAAASAAMQARGENEDADSLLEPFYCTDLQPVWASGQQLKGKSCLGVTIFVNPKPVLGKPLSYTVGVTNHSGTRIDVDWTQWSLAWKSSKETNINPALDPDTIVHSLEKRSLIAGSLAAFGASMSASAPRTAAVISGPAGTSTLTVYPSPAQASAAASDAAARAEEPGMKLAGTLSDYSLRRTTLLPGNQVGGTIVYFAKPKDKGDVWLEIRIDGVPKFSIQVNGE
jgi:hypothetical protein